MASLKLFFLLMSFTGAEPDILQVRNLYQQAALQETKATTLLELLEGTQSDPTLRGYKGAVTMLMAKYDGNPYQKIRYFNDGKALLEDALREAPANVELRYLRYTIQKNAPSFLGYESNLREDKAFLESAVQSLTDSQLKSLILTSLHS